MYAYDAFCYSSVFCLGFLDCSQLLSSVVSLVFVHTSALLISVIVVDIGAALFIPTAKLAGFPAGSYQCPVVIHACTARSASCMYK